MAKLSDLFCISNAVYLGQIKGIKLPVLRLLEGHDLHVQRPVGVVLALDGVVEVVHAKVRVGGEEGVGRRRVEVLHALAGAPAELVVHRLPVGVDQLVGVRAPAVHVAEAVRDAAVAEHPRHLVHRLRAEGEEVPAGVVVDEVRLRIALLRVDEAHEEEGVAHEEDRRVVAW